MTKKEQEQTTDIIPVIAETKDIKSLIYVDLCCPWAAGYDG